jgi:Tol biopolymer transport system component/C-terminal processing protease CtpA/Prc
MPVDEPAGAASVDEGPVAMPVDEPAGAASVDEGPVAMPVDEPAGAASVAPTRLGCQTPEFAASLSPSPHPPVLQRVLAPALLASLRLVLTSTALDAQSATEPGWLRSPAISPDGRTLVFTYRGDLWRVPSAGGDAVPLTQHPAHDMLPVWSPDGRQLAFASDRHGNFDVFVMPAEGGPARRLTVHSAPEYPYGFTPDGEAVLFGAARGDLASNRQYPTANQPELWRVPVTGGRPLQLLATPAEDARLSRDGRYLVYHDKKGGENVWRKRHRSAITRDLWLHDTQDGSHQQLTRFDGEDRSPVFTDDDRALYYLSEETGTFNVHRLTLATGASEPLTRFTGAPVRFLSAATDGTVAFSHDGQLYTMRPGAQPVRVPVRIATDAKANTERVLPIAGGVQGVVMSPNGKEIAFTFRGDVFVASVEGGVTKQVTRTPGTEVGVQFAPDGQSLVYAAERDGRWAIQQVRRTRAAEPYFYASTVLAETPLLANARQNTQPKFSPDGRELAFIEDRNTLRVLTLATGATRTLLTDAHIDASGPTHRFEWSPDGRWMLFDLSVPGLAPGEVGLVPTDGNGPVRNLTRSGFRDGRGAWILGGAGMLWFSNRDGLKGVAQAGGAQQDAYALFFTRAAWDRFQLSKEELALVKEEEERAAKARGADTATARAAAAPLTLELDPDALDVRRARLTIHSSSLGDALVSKDGETLYYLARFERGFNLWSTNLRTQETKQVLALNANSASMQWDHEQKRILLVSNGQVSTVEPASAKREPIPISGEMVVNADAERAAQFDQVWRRVRDTYYTAGFHGADWDALRPLYEKHLPHVSNGHEFAELLAEMLGELNVSHSGATFSSSESGDDATAALGALFDPTWAGAGARLVEVLPGGPLDRVEARLSTGTLLLAVDGDTITANTDLAALLNRKAGKPVLLALQDGTRRVELVVRPITQAEEGRLLYARWVRRNREEVERRSNGRLGYVHIPGMNDGAYRTTFEEVMGRYADKDGLVVDTRFNGGGDLVADLAMFLTGEKFFEYTTDTRSGGFEPNFRWTKPSVALANEANYSDGHCFAYAYRQLGIGPLVGMPVPGTCTFAGWQSLPDGVRWGVPGLGVKDSRTGQYLENLQTEPDVRVMNEYPVVITGRDQQLEAAVDALLQRLR